MLNSGPGQSRDGRPSLLRLSEAPIMDVTRNGKRVDGRFDVNEYTAWAELPKELPPAGANKDPVRHGQHHPVETDKGFKRNQLDAVFPFRFGRIRKRIGDRRRYAEFS